MKTLEGWKVTHGKSILLTPREREILDALVSKGSLKEACAFLGIAYNTGNARIFRIRSKYENASVLVREYERYKLRVQDKSNLYL